MRRRITKMAARFLAFWAVGPALCLGQAPDRDDAAAAAPRAEQGSAAPRQAGVPARPADPANAGPASSRKMDMERLLKLWEHQSSLLKTLDVKIFRVDQNPAWDEVEYYDGRALFKSPNLAFIDFNKIKQDEKKKPVPDPKNKTKWLATPFERIVCTGQEVWQYKSDTQQIFIFPLGKNEQKKAIEEGPLPFLFNMHATDAKARYAMTLISEDQKSYGVSIKPKLPEDKESFSIAFVELDRNFLLPIRIVMKSPDGKSRKDFKLREMKPNSVVNDKNFEGRPLGLPWKIVRNPAGEDRPRAAANRARGAQGEPAAAGPRPGGIERE